MSFAPFKPTLAAIGAAALTLMAGAAQAVPTTVYGLQLMGESITGGHVDFLPTKINDFGRVIGAASLFDGNVNLGLQGFVTDIGGTNFRYLVPTGYTGASTPFTTAIDLNNAGQVLGSTVRTVNGTPTTQYFLWNETSGVQALPSITTGSPWPGAGTPMGWVDARAINDAGIVIGTVASSPQSFNGQPLAWDSRTGVATLLPMQTGGFPTGASFSSGVALAISNSNLVVGSLSSPSTPGGRSGTWNLAVNGALTLMTAPGASPLPNAPMADMGVRAVNDAGQAVGYFRAPGSSQSQLFFWDPVSRTSTLIPATNMSADGGTVGKLMIAADGTVTGTVGTGQAVFTWKPGQTEATVISGGGTISVEAHAANNAGQAVGYGFSGWNGTTSNLSALLWQDGQVTDLNTLVTLPDGWRLTQAESINNRGQIAGIVRTATGDSLGFVLSPQGTAPSAPLLPTEGTAATGWSFQATVQADTPYFFDPDVAVGYEYEVRSGPSIKSVLLPANIGDGRYALWTWDGQAYVDAGITLFGGQTYTFDDAVTRFAVHGIETSAMLDPTSATAFVTGFTFDGSGAVDLSQRAITEYVPSVPEPGSWLLMGAGLAVLAGLRRRAMKA